ncbi:hypothetical protein AVV30_gp106 [Vibrio phage phi 1]|uniref:Uncharacterized protein n=1 Tax=Vibrio phage phi 1 TaxID=1589297 RepID=A0A0B5HAK4_9CAUD|nr:hypothetical protein AVV30_gp106 [Vibrio phage phi 1]AJF40764.1 hypothetical protein SBVP1_0106 [Vibrio phage phi 1]
MQLIETYTSAKGIPIWFKFNSDSFLQRQFEKLKITGNGASELSTWKRVGVLKKPTGKTWGELCN